MEMHLQPCGELVHTQSRKLSFSGEAEQGGKVEVNLFHPSDAELVMDIDRVFSVRKDMYLQHIQTFPEPIPNFPVSQYYQYLSSMF